ncbi:MAG: hypothetical protein COV99_05025 [Bacteroidetes bacterium CG12_big_fil_rev_8_21_14_0_65_60_17]|nr:MAG: hypothetical protein COV99_05025 [Bacteroidetes bacterium CG12_big_fil_rev_8_21_14_0_65_60_17]
MKQKHERDLSNALRSMVERERDRALGPMAADRIVRAARTHGLIGHELPDLLVQGIIGWARPVVAVCLTILLLLVAYNVRLSTELPGMDTPTARVLGLPSVTVALAFDPDFEDH